MIFVLKWDPPVMKALLLLILSVAVFKTGFSQSKNYMIGVKGDTLNKIDLKGQKQGKWVNHVDELRGEPGYEEEGVYQNDRKEGAWRVYNLNGDLTAFELYKWGLKDGVCQYFNSSGALIREESWFAMNPDKLYDTLDVEDVDHLNVYQHVIVKNEGAAIKNGTWKYYDPITGMIYKTENYTLGKPETTAKTTTKDTSTVSKNVPKPKEVMEYEKKNAGKKKVRTRDGATGY
jgi:antitoxin component YwqK of YwqJK toxin-antitoxin module